VVRNRITIGEDMSGIAYVMIGMLSLTIGTLLTKRLAPGLDLFVMVGAQQAGAGLTLLAGAALMGESLSQFVIGPTLLATTLWFVFVISIASFLLWFFLLRRGSAASASSLHFLMPPLGLLMSWALLGEKLNPLDLLGVIPVALGIWLATTEAVPSKPVTS
jgi:drug/metabolite transporter (DMT)-like permease